MAGLNQPSQIDWVDAAPQFLSDFISPKCRELNISVNQKRRQGRAPSAATDLLNVRQVCDAAMVRTESELVHKWRIDAEIITAAMRLADTDPLPIVTVRTRMTMDNRPITVTVTLYVGPDTVYFHFESTDGANSWVKMASCYEESHPNRDSSLYPKYKMMPKDD